MGGKRHGGQKAGGQKAWGAKGRGAKGWGAKDPGAKDRGGKDRGAKVLSPFPIANYMKSVFADNYGRSGSTPHSYMAFSHRKL